MSTLLSAHGLVKRFGHIQALRGVDMEIAKGRSLVLLGPNGAGKSTLLSILAGRARPSGGQVIYKDQNVRNGSSIRGNTGYLSHATLLYDGLTAAENLGFYARLYGIGDRAQKCDDMLRFMGLWERRGDRVGGFSRGMKQRLSIARVLLHDPDLILLDEPFSGLDHGSSRMLANALSQLQNGQRTLVTATHDLDFVPALADTVAVMDRGRVVFQGPVEGDIKAHYLAALSGEIL